MTASESLALAARLRDALSAPAPSAGTVRPLLRPDAGFDILGRTLTGADAVARELTEGPTGELAHQLQWGDPQQVADRIRLAGVPPPQGTMRGLVLTLQVRHGAIDRVQAQKTSAKPLPARPLVLPEAIKRMVNDALVERHPMLLAYVGPDGQPILSYRGSVQADGDDRLAMWIRQATGLFVRCIQERPKVALTYRNEDTKATYHFQGRARVSDAPADRERLFARMPQAERAHDFAQQGVVVLVDLDRVEGYAGLGPAGQIDGIHLRRTAPT